MRLVSLGRPLLAALSAASVGLCQGEVPSEQDLIRRAYGRATVLGDHLYVEGGAITRKDVPRWRWAEPMNATLSIDLSTSWKVEEVEIRRVPRPSEMMPTNWASIFRDESEGVFYIWGGEMEWGNKIKEPELWSFKPDGDGGGSWSEADFSGFEDFQRVENGAYVSTPNSAFVFGGWSNTNTSLEPTGNTNGHVEFNFTTKKWSADTTAPYSSNAAVWGGSAVFAPSFGPNGFIFVLGGMSEWTNSPGFGGDVYLDFATLHFMDPVTKKWQFQETTGEAPSGRIHHCAVGVAGANNTFEIFVYGGSSRIRATDYSDLYILSLPGFRWEKVRGLDSTRRSNHVCNVAGKRQMLSWGGINPYNEGRVSSFALADPLPQGLGILDLSTLKWKSEYDSKADAYESPSVIQEWYANGGLDSVDWSSDEVRQAFVSKKEEDDDSDKKEGNGDDKPGASKEDPPKEDSDGSVSTAAIAGGVVGGVVGALMLGLGLWFLRRRRRGAAGAEAEIGTRTETGTGTGTATGTGVVAEVESKPNEPFLPTEYYKRELDSRTVSELHTDSGAVAELHSNNGWVAELEGDGRGAVR